MKITRRQLLGRLLNAVCAIPFIGSRIEAFDPVHSFLFEQKGWATIPVSEESIECDAEAAMLSTLMQFDFAMSTMLAECVRDGFKPIEIKFHWVTKDDPTGGQFSPFASVQINIIRRRV